MSKPKNAFQIKLNVDETTYLLYNALDNKAKKRLRTLLKLIILAVARDEEIQDVLKISSEISLSDDFKEFVQKVVFGHDNKCDEAKSILKTLLNAIENTPSACEMLYFNPHLLNKAREVVSP